AAGAAALLLLESPAAALAHGFEKRYDLPIPLDMFLLGAGSAVVLSFVVMGLFLRSGRGHFAYPRYDLLRLGLFRLLARPGAVLAARLLAAGVFLLTILAGFFGEQNPLRNLIVTMVWIIWWVGMAYACSLFGDLWALLNPWGSLFAWAGALHRRIRPGRSLSLGLPLPAWVGAWPAVALFLWFAWAEIGWRNNYIPANLAFAASIYSLITWWGMALFGREAWLARGEAFSVVFGLLGRFGVTEAGRGPAGRPEWNLRPPSVGLLAAEAPHPSAVALVIAVLATVTFDGFTETAQWQALRSSLFDAFAWLDARTAFQAADAFALLAAPLLFFLVYAGFGWLMARAGGSAISTGEAVRRFVFSLVPIAIGYHLAHYFSYLFIQGQRLIPLASDPFGWGWNLLGTAGYEVDIASVDAGTVWNLSLVAIVAGHIFAVYLAHVVALGAFGDRRLALRSQYPMLALMVGYTVLSLWIIAQPIVN
ncbi:MAG: hypothetical protein HYY66_09970, partial [Candidatus Tectomicrobia bacterium]|nr:hypothetical protein [Candidatus Tectomicrobia bacterium]